MKHLQYQIWLFTALLVLGGCKKEVDQFIPLLEPIDFDFSEEFTTLGDTLVYPVDGTIRITLTTPKGSEFILKGDMFEYTNGEFCPCEEILVKIIELAEKRDYVVHQKPTISHGQVLISAGAYHFSAYYKGMPLQMIADEQLCLILPANKLDDDMELFYGEETSTTFNWTPANALPGSRAILKAGEWQTDSSLIVGYECFSDRLGWINIDKLASDGTKNPVCIKLDDFYTDKNTVVFAVLVNEKSILTLYYDSTEGGFCASNIPEGLEVLFIGVSKKGADLYEMATENRVIDENHFQSLTFITKDFDLIKSFLMSL